MITVKSNINEFLKNYRKKVGDFKSTLNVLAEKLVERIKSDMLRVIENKQFVWQEEAGNLAEIDPSDIDFTTTQVGENTIRVSIGERLPRVPMSDGTLVNPVYFIEFGFGIEGQESPMQNRDKYGWRYNINQNPCIASSTAKSACSRSSIIFVSSPNSIRRSEPLFCSHSGSPAPLGSPVAAKFAQ